MKSLAWAAVLLLGVAPSAHAQVLITEVQPNPLGTTSDGAEWIELHNTGGAAADVSGWGLAEYATGASYVFGAGTSLAAGQVVIVTLNAADFTTMATAASFPVTTANFELALDTDDAGVPNLTQSAAGSFALANSGGGVILLDNNGQNVSWAEWGSGRAEVPGNPSGAPGDGASIVRVNNTGSSDVDFMVAATPTPGTGFGGVTPSPPTITSPVRAPASVAYGATFTVSSSVTDADGIATVEVLFATATSSLGNAAAAYVAAPATNTAGNNWRASGVINTLVAFPDPTGFTDRYVRYFIRAADNNANNATLPVGAVTMPENTAFYWENVLPQNGVFPLSEVRSQNASELPIYDGHSVRVEGVALTDTEAFFGGATNFFIAAPAGVDAIRIFDDTLIATPVQPGDMVRVTGKVGAYRGVRQIGRDERAGQPAVLGGELEVQVIGTAAVPMVISDVQTLVANGEQNESQLVEVDNVMLVPNPNNGDPIPLTWEGNTTLYVSDGSGTLAVRIASFVDLADTPTPSGTFDLRGIFTQFAPSGTGGYQLQPRSLADVIGGGPPFDAGVSDGGGDDGGMDTGTADAGQDTGVAADTGTGGQDASGGVDAAKDAGFFGTDPGRDGCGCSVTSTNERSTAAIAWFFLAVVALRPRRTKPTQASISKRWRNIPD